VRQRLVLAALAPVVIALGGIGTAHAAPTIGDTPVNHGQCVKESPQPAGAGGRSTTAKSKSSCTLPLSCVATEDTGDEVTLDSAENTVTIDATGEGDSGSALQCAARIPVTAGDTISFEYELGEDTAECGGGVPRVYVLIGGTYYNTFDGDTDCSNQVGDKITYTLPVSGTVTEIGFVYDRGDAGSVTYSRATVGGAALNI
jgi:hypothetical protein